MKALSCYSCLHLMTPDQSADGLRRCRVDRKAEQVSPQLEADCRRYVRAVGSDDSVPEWYAEAWEQGRGD